jgi:hypothetical protein
MIHTHLIIPRPLLVTLALIGALLACTASLDGGDDSGGTGDGTGGARLPANQRVDITVETDTPATSFLLNVSGRVASSKALPSGQTGPTKAILSWTPDRQGTFTLEVIAFNGAAASVPASLMIEVSGTASVTTPGQTGICTGRALVSELNFRDSPSTGGSRLGQFDVGETATVIGRNADTTWYKVQRINAQQVWVINNAQWMQIEGDCAGVAVVG